MRTSALLLALGVLLALPGCEYSPEPGTVILRFSHSSDAEELVQGKLTYESPAGYPYSVGLFEYLITDIRLWRPNGTYLQLADVHYGNAFEPGVANRIEREVPLGRYVALSFRWGVEWFDRGNGPEFEPLGPEYDGMLWPAPMGGGYHCMRLEGKYTVDTPGDKSFIMHMGRTAPVMDPGSRVTDASVVIQLDEASMLVDDGNRWDIRIDIDIDRFLDDPLFDWEAPSDIPADGGGFRTLAFPTMPSHMAQELMRENAHDVFSVATSRK